MSIPYRYEPLRYDLSIRILYLHPEKSPDSPINLDLRETSIHEARTNFDALSYVWGESKKRIEVLCCGKYINVGPNCEAALRRLRSKTRVKALFVDAICIDQNNEDEKPGQIELMGDVYKAAKRVLIWLGDGSAKIDLAFKDIRRLYRFRRLFETKNRRLLELRFSKFLRELIWVRSIVHDRMLISL
jgi:hypothetical protein